LEVAAALQLVWEAADRLCARLEGRSLRFGDISLVLLVGDLQSLFIFVYLVLPESLERIADSDAVRRQRK